MRRLFVLSMVVLVATAASGAALGATVSATQTTDGECQYPIELEDATGEAHTIEETPESIVALHPSDAQKLFKIGADDRVVGMPVSQYTDGLDVDDQTDITGDDGLEVIEEEVIALDPDIVLAASIADEGVVDQLRDAGIDVYVFESAASLEQVSDDIETAGQLAGACDGANVANEWMTERLETIDEAVADEDHPLTLYAMDDEGFTAGSATFQHEVLTTAGVENLAAEAGIEMWEPISDETVLDEDPEWIVYGEFWGAEPPVSDALNETTAMQEGQYAAVDDSDMSQPAPKTVYAVEEIFAAIHTDAHSEVEADLASIDAAYEESLEALATAEDVGDDHDDAETGDDADEADDHDEPADNGADDADTIPGFGSVAALAALLAGSAFVIRRR